MEQPKRRQNRLTEFDYDSPYAYFITVCTARRRNLFWENPGAAVGRPEDVRLSQYGRIADQCIRNIPRCYPMVAVDRYVIMPDHIHLLLRILPEDGGRAMPAPTVSRVVQQMKGAVTKKIGSPVWQKGFYDHVVRGEADYREIWEYIEGNPMKWKPKKPT